MAHYAFLDENNVVTEVITGIDETETIEGLDPETWYGNFRNQKCKRTSYNTQNGVHKNGGEPFRHTFAYIGSFYNEELDKFKPMKPFNNWIFNEETYNWEPPTQKPEGSYIWNDETISWVEVI